MELFLLAATFSGSLQSLHTLPFARFVTVKAVDLLQILPEPEKPFHPSAFMLIFIPL